MLWRVLSVAGAALSPPRGDQCEMLSGGCPTEELSRGGTVQEMHDGDHQQPALSNDGLVGSELVGSAWLTGSYDDQSATWRLMFSLVTT